MSTDQTLACIFAPVGNWCKSVTQLTDKHMLAEKQVFVSGLNLPLHKGAFWYARYNKKSLQISLQWQIFQSPYNLKSNDRTRILYKVDLYKLF